MTERRWPWWCASTLLLLSAIAGAGAVYLHWLPCRGTMVSGSLWRHFRYGPDFTDACLTAMDNGFSFLYPPGADERWGAESLCGVAAASLAGAAWLVVVITARWARTTKLVAAVPSLATTALVVFSLTAAGSASRVEGRVSTALLVALNLAGVLAFIVIARRMSPPWDLLRIALMVSGSTAFGLVQAIADYVVAISLSDANWDTPPGTGSATVLGIAVAAVWVAVLTVRRTAEQRREAAPGALSRPAGTRDG